MPRHPNHVALSAVRAASVPADGSGIPHGRTRPITCKAGLKAFCLALALAAGGLNAVPALACPMCKIAQEDATDPAVAVRPKAYMYSILFMLSMPATLFGIFSVAFYRLSLKQQAVKDAVFTEFDAAYDPRNEDHFSA
jgi:hypothetical protein